MQEEHQLFTCLDKARDRRGEREEEHVRKERRFIEQSGPISTGSTTKHANCIYFVWMVCHLPLDCAFVEEYPFEYVYLTKLN